MTAANNDTISSLMAQIGGLRSELADARARHDVLAGSLANTLAACADLRAERDALQEAAIHAVLTGTGMVRTWLDADGVVHTEAVDATDPRPTLVAETRKAFPWRAIRGGDGRFMG